MSESTTSCQTQQATYSSWYVALLMFVRLSIAGITVYQTCWNVLAAVSDLNQCPNGLRVSVSVF